MAFLTTPVAHGWEAVRAAHGRLLASALLLDAAEERDAIPGATAASAEIDVVAHIADLER
jgi:hypothetical protein